MSKLFSNKVFLQIFSVVMLVLMINSYMINKNIKEYAYKNAHVSLNNNIDRLFDINKVIYAMYNDNDFEKEFHIDHIWTLDTLDIEINKMFGIDKAVFNWFRLERMWINILDIKRRGRLSKEDEKYLKSVHMYNQDLIKAYYRVIEEKNINKDYKKAKQEYKNFMEEANKITIDEKYKGIFKYKVNK
ncbi:hypothetical protein [Tepidibacter sp. Z1-5]|uniref:hypothetical protein n=1 Tax=Tepidibacter sp. Z1-5 TaxID=3134138 RepID=UPI0030C480F0